MTEQEKSHEGGNGARSGAAESTSDNAQTAFSFDELLAPLMRSVRPTEVAQSAWHIGENSILCGGRIRVGAPIGQGAAATVFEAMDGARPVALKVLRHIAAAGIYRLKNEFRKLTGLRHPNVISVHELVCEGGAWFFTMDRIGAETLEQYLSRNRCLDNTTMRHVLHQIVEGVAAIHDAGLVHRDLKPSNILITPEGHLVIVDFGLVGEQELGGSGQTLDGVICGTPRYMAPEQAMGRHAQPASDWYAVGSILYEMLWATPPFHGSARRVLQAKQEGRRPSFGAQMSGELDLVALCAELMDSDPGARPSVSRLLALVRTPEARVAPQLPAPSVAFEGRSHALQQLHAAYQRLDHAQPQIVWIVGDSGQGKSALLREFQRHLAHGASPVVLSSQCYQRETIPFRGLDGIIDSYARVVARLSTFEVNQLLPRYLVPASKLFPTLLRIQEFAKAVATGLSAPQGDTQDFRAKGLSGVKDLFFRLAERRRVVVLVDDAQWIDADTCELMRELVGPPEPPPLLYVFTGTCIPSSWRAREGSFLEVRVEYLQLGPLSSKEAVRLARQLLGNREGQGGIKRIARVSAGVPAFLVDLARFGSSASITRSVSHDALIDERINALSPEELHLLELLALAARPMPIQLLAPEFNAPVPRLFSALLRSGLAVPVRISEHSHAEISNKRIAQRLSSKRSFEAAKNLHRVLARSWRASDPVEEERVIEHLLAAGAKGEAAMLAESAARRADARLGFLQAADYYALALTAPECSEEALRVLRELRASALANAGMGALAGDAYQEAAREASEPEASRLLTKAATHWLRCGRVDEGKALLNDLLRKARIYQPKHALALLLVFIWRRILVVSMRMRLVLVSEQNADAGLLRQLDALYPAITALGVVDYLRGAYYASVALPLALRAGEPRRLINSLGAEVIYETMLTGLRRRKRRAKLEGVLNTVAAHDPKDAYTSAGVQLCRKLCAYWEGRWAGWTTEAEAAFEQHVPGSLWELTLLRSVRHTVQLHSGFLGIEEELVRTLHSAEVSNDTYATVDLLRTSYALALARNSDVEATRIVQRLESLLAECSYPALTHLILSIRVAQRIQSGATGNLMALFRHHRRACLQTGLTQFPLVRVMLASIEVECVAEGDGSRAQRGRELSRLASVIQKEPVEWAPALATSASGSAAYLRGDVEEAARLLVLSANTYQGYGLTVRAAAERFRAAALVDPECRSEAFVTAGQALQALGIRNPSNWIRHARSLF